MTNHDRVNEFLRLHARHEARVHGFILALLPDWNDAEEVLQETATVLWSKFDQFESGTNYFAWACQVARYEVIRYLRRQHRDRLCFSEETVAKLTGDAAEIGEQLSGRQAALVGCVKKLSEKDEMLVRLRYDDGLDGKAIAAQVGRSVHAVYKAMRRIHRLLYECVQETLSREGST